MKKIQLITKSKNKFGTGFYSTLFRKCKNKIKLYVCSFTIAFCNLILSGSYFYTPSSMLFVVSVQFTLKEEEVNKILAALQKQMEDYQVSFKKLNNFFSFSLSLTLDFIRLQCFILQNFFLFLFNFYFYF